MTIYLLSLKELNNGVIGEKLAKECLLKLDTYRLEKVQKLRMGSARNGAIGAGLLLQLASVWDAGQDFRADGHGQVHCVHLTISELLKHLDSEEFPRRIAYSYGTHGKPDFEKGDKHFNLSHSGGYVCCAVGLQEMGIDLQDRRPLKNFRIAQRYFSEKEKTALERCVDPMQKEELFYRIWVKKEAYAKLTGEGIATGVTVDTYADGGNKTADAASGANRVVWQELEAPEGYCMAVCCYRSIF